MQAHSGALAYRFGCKKWFENSWLNIVRYTAAGIWDYYINIGTRASGFNADFAFWFNGLYGIGENI